MRNKQNITGLMSPQSCRGVARYAPTVGLKVRKSLAQGNSLWHRRSLSIPEAPTGRDLFVRIAPLQGLAFAGHLFRRALPYAIDYRAFSPAFNTDFI
jgi:hypothetical protein